MAVEFTSWPLHSFASHKARKSANPSEATECPRCGALSEVEHYNSILAGNQVRKRLIRCPNAKGKIPTCEVTTQILEEDKAVPFITAELKERIQILKSGGVLMKQIAEKAGCHPNSLSSFFSGKVSLNSEGVEQAVAALELDPPAPPPPPPLAKREHAAKRPRGSNCLPKPLPMIEAERGQPLSIDHLVEELLRYPADVRAEILQLVHEQDAVNERRRAIQARLTSEAGFEGHRPIFFGDLGSALQLLAR